MIAPNFGHELITKAKEINEYMHRHEGPYALSKTSLMLGRLAAQYRDIPVFVSATIAVVPDEHGVSAGMAEVTGAISGFSFDEYPASILTDKLDSGVVLNVSTPSYNGVHAKDAEEWRLNVLPLELRNRSIDGFVINVPLIEGQDIVQIGEKPEEITADALSESPELHKQYSYKEYVDKINALTGQRPTVDIKLDAPRLQAINELLHHMVFDCPFLGEVIAIKSEYIRSPKPNNEEGFKVVTGMIGGVLRRFALTAYQDYRTKQWKSDVHPVVYAERIAYMVATGEITPEFADSSPTTFFVPLSEPHMLVTKTSLKS